MSTKQKNIYLSFVIPVYNEAENIANLYAEIQQVIQQLGKPCEIIFADDGSTDNTVATIEQLSSFVLIKLRGNYGQTAALAAGIDQAQGELIVTLDGDGQNDPADVPKMIELLNKEQKDVVCGWRKKRQDDASKRFISDGARWLRSFLVQDGITDSGCTLRVYRRICFEDVVLRGEMHRFIPALLRWRGFNLAEIPVNHRPRQYGVSKYNWKRMVKGFLDMLNLWFFYKFHNRPLHFLGAVGGGLFTTGFGLLFILGLGRFFRWWQLGDSIWPLVAVFLVLFGFQMFISGLMMDLIISHSGKKKYYAVKEIISKV